MYNSHHSQPHTSPNSLTSPKQDSNVEDLSVFAAKFESLNNSSHVSVSHHNAVNTNGNVTLDADAIDNLVHTTEREHDDSNSLEKEFDFDVQDHRNTNLIGNDIEQTTNALMEMAHSTLTSSTNYHSHQPNGLVNIHTTTSLERPTNLHSELIYDPEDLNSNTITDQSQQTKPDEKSKSTVGKFQKTCQFCGRVFTHPGSLGRHLDLKRGTRLHPADQIDIIRADVKRRGDIVEVKARRAQRAKAYNAREDVKERARIRRRQKGRLDRFRAQAQNKFMERIGMPSLPPHPSFAYVVLYFLQPSLWPHDPPTSQTLDQLQHALQPLESINSKTYADYLNKVNVAFEQWKIMNKQSRMEIWHREQRRVAEAALGSLSLYDLGSRQVWLEKEVKRLSDLDEARKLHGDGQQRPLSIGNTDDDTMSNINDLNGDHDDDYDGNLGSDPNQGDNSGAVADVMVSSVRDPFA